MRASSRSPNVWPGYVAAVAGLAITLLLVIAILGGNLFLVSQAAMHERRPADRDDDPASQSPLAAAPPELVDAGAPVPVPVRVPEPPRRDWPTVSAATPSPPPGPRSHREPGPTSHHARHLSTTVGRIALTFDEDAHALDDEVRASLRTALSSLPAERGVRLTAVVPVDAPGTTRRAAYIRLMAVRNALLDLDIAAGRIQFALDEAGAPADPSAAEPGARTVVIEAVPAAIEGERHAR